MVFACFLMLLCAIPALFSLLVLASWLPLAVAYLAAVALVNNPSQLQWFILCYISPFNVGSHAWAVTFSLGCGGLTVALNPGLPFLLGHIPLLAVRFFEGQLVILHPSLLYPACDWSGAVAQMLWDTGAWQLCRSWGPAAFRQPRTYVPWWRTFWWKMKGWQVKWRSSDSRNPPYCKMSAAVCQYWLSLLVLFLLYHANRTG